MYGDSACGLDCSCFVKVLFRCVGPFGELLARFLVFLEVRDGVYGLEGAPTADDSLAGVHELEVEGGGGHDGGWSRL